MTSPKVTNYFIASNSYQKISKNFDKIGYNIEDVVSIQGGAKFDLDGVKTVIHHVNSGKDLLYSGDKILVSDSAAIEERRRKNSFMEVLKQKFSNLTKGENTSRAAMNNEAKTKTLIGLLS